MDIYFRLIHASRSLNSAEHFFLHGLCDIDNIIAVRHGYDRIYYDLCIIELNLDPLGKALYADKLNKLSSGGI